MGGDQVRVMEGPAVSIRGVTCKFGDVVAVNDVSLDVSRGEFVSLLGPSGCGKTTLLRIIAGLQRQTAGTVLIDGHDVSATAPHKRPVGLVFQRYALFPHKTVADNVGFSLMLKRVPKEERARRVNEMLELVRLGGFGDRQIDELSGGQAQRVALARALVDDPPVLLLDEPLAALDLKLRQAMHLELRDIQERVGSTFIYVTHDQEEALVMSDRVVLMDGGRIVQQGPPLEVYQRPATLFAATFLGEANLFPIQSRASEDGDERVDAGSIRFLVETAGALADAEFVCLRPERIDIAPGRPDGDVNVVGGQVSRVVFLGSVVRYEVRAGDGLVTVDVASTDGDVPLAVGDEVVLRWSPTAPVLVRGA